MTDKGIEHGLTVRAMFARISQRYDLLNRIMTLGQDGRWRKETIQSARVNSVQWLIDLGAGTGDLALEAQRQYPNTKVVAVDFTPEMLRLGREKSGGDLVFWVVADGKHLPFKDDVFDSSVSAFLVRNLFLPDPVLVEQIRVLVPGGKTVSLDTSPPPRSIFQPFIGIYLNFFVPLLGKLFAGDHAAYSYLRDSTRRFLSAEELEGKMTQAGFIEVKSVKRMFGIIAIHSGRKPEHPARQFN